MQLYVARHGQTQWNVDLKVCGRTDIPLTETGIQQAKVLAEDAKDKNIDLILVSPLLRARQTAAVVAEKCGIPVIVDERLIEQDYGEYEGVNRLHPGFLHCKRNFGTRYPGGESMLDIACRIYDLLDEIPKKYPDKVVLLVCHGGVMRTIRTYFEDMTNEEYFGYSASNACLTEYEYR